MRQGQYGEQHQTINQSIDPDTSERNKQAPLYSIMIQFCLISMICIYTNKRNQSNTYRHPTRPQLSYTLNK